MKQADVVIGAYYCCKVSGKLTIVKILRESCYSGWDAENIGTGRLIRLKSARRLQYRVTSGLHQRMEDKAKEVTSA